MAKKIPSTWALELAQLHNKVMELQDMFNGFKNDIWGGVDEEAHQEMLNNEGIDLLSDELMKELEHICDKLEDLEADTSELDCEYNDYGY